MQIKEIPHTDVPVELLLDADPSIEKINSYLPGSRCFVVTFGNKIIGVCVVAIISPGVYELMNISVAPDERSKGIGTKLLKHVIATAREAGGARLEIGTGTFGYQLAYYQRQGFRAFAVDRDFFLRNYEEPIFENGIQHRDMLRLAIDF